MGIPLSNLAYMKNTIGNLKKKKKTNKNQVEQKTDYGEC